MKRLFVAVLILTAFVAVANAQSYRDIVQNNLTAWATRVAIDSAAIYSSPSSGEPSSYLLKNMSVLVYDSTDTYYKIARPPVGFIGYISKRDVQQVTSKSMAVQPVSPGAGLIGQGSSKNQNIKIRWGNLATAIGLAFVAYDYMSTASDIQDAIDEAKSSNVDTGNLEDQKSRKQLVGYALLAGAIMNGIFSFEKVEVQATPNSVALTYSIPIGN